MDVVAETSRHALNRMADVSIAHAQSGHGAAEQAPNARVADQCEQQLRRAKQWHEGGLIDSNTLRETTHNIATTCLHIHGNE